MAGTRKAPLWRQAFLRALRRTGNVRASAFEAGVDPGTAYDHRAKDAGFRGKWAGALKGFKAAEARNPPSRKAMADKGEELVLRRAKDGDKLVRAAAGRWSRRVEESFLDGLEATGSVAAAAAAAGMSTAAFYKRRDNYPEFRARWEERVGRFQEQLPGLINAAAVQSMEPELPGAKRRGRARLPKLGAGEAIRVYAINENARAKARGPARRGGVSSRERDEQSQEELVEVGVRLLGMMKRRRAAERLAAGWTDYGNGIWVPPGWTARPPSPDPSADKGPDDPPAPSSGP
jgi:hypothetical protein